MRLDFESTTQCITDTYSTNSMGEAGGGGAGGGGS